MLSTNLASTEYVHCTLYNVHQKIYQQHVKQLCLYFLKLIKIEDTASNKTCLKNLIEKSNFPLKAINSYTLQAVDNF